MTGVTKVGRGVEMCIERRESVLSKSQIPNSNDDPRT